MIDWMMWYPDPRGSLSGSRNVSTLSFWYSARKFHPRGMMRSPVATRLSSVFKRIPTKRTMDPKRIMSIKAVPRSGCLNTRTKGTRTIKKGATSSRIPYFFSTRWSLKYFASARIRVIFTISEGCMEKPPRLIQRWEPFVTAPTAKTAIRSTMASPCTT